MTFVAIKGGGEGAITRRVIFAKGAVRNGPWPHCTAACARRPATPGSLCECSSAASRVRRRGLSGPSGPSNISHGRAKRDSRLFLVLHNTSRSPGRGNPSRTSSHAYTVCVVCGVRCAVCYALCNAHRPASRSLIFLAAARPAGHGSGGRSAAGRCASPRHSSRAARRPCACRACACWGPRRPPPASRPATTKQNRTNASCVGGPSLLLPWAGRPGLGWRGWQVRAGCQCGMRTRPALESATADTSSR